MLTHSNSGKVFVAAATFSTPTCKIRLVAFRCKPCKGSSLEMYKKASSPTTLQSFMWEIKWKGLKRWYKQILFPSKLSKFRNLIKFNFGGPRRKQISLPCPRHHIGWWRYESHAHQQMPQLIPAWQTYSEPPSNVKADTKSLRNLAAVPRIQGLSLHIPLDTKWCQK